MAKFISPRIVTDGLVLCLDAANRQSYPGTGNAWNDLSGYNNNGTMVQSPTFVLDKQFDFEGGSITSTGQVDSFEILDNKVLDEITEITVEMWIKIISVQGTGSPNMLFSKRTVNTNGYVGFFSSNGFVFRIGTSSPTQLSWNTIPDTSAWQQIILTVSGNGGNVYKNGIKVINNPSYTGNFSNINTNTSLLIGDINPNNIGIYGFNGSFSIFKIYNRELSSSEILQNYNALKGRFGL